MIPALSTELWELWIPVDRRVNHPHGQHRVDMLMGN
jgi:hypothetical protein